MGIKILSVDFDWIMEPAINIYNELANGTNDLDSILKENPGVQVECDFQKYKLLCTYVKNICRKIILPDRIQFRTNHEEIIDCIENVWKIKNEKYDLYNIDHHHDCGYRVNTLQDVVDQGLTCGNWVMYCKDLRNYTWINNKNSVCDIIEDVFKKIPHLTYISDINLLNFIDFDYVFVCLSPGWVPSKLYPLFDILDFITVKDENTQENIEK